MSLFVTEACWKSNAHKSSSIPDVLPGYRSINERTDRLYDGDCLNILRDDMRLGSEGLLYLDPPFNSNRAYNAVYEDETDRP